MKLLDIELPHKYLRACVIKSYMRNAGYAGCVCFSCGHASRALCDMGVDTLDISPTGDLITNRWWQPWEIRRMWPARFDATSGHLPIHVMRLVGHAYRTYIVQRGGGFSNRPVDVPCGSGETLVCLKLAYPSIKFNAVYNNNYLATAYNEEAPLNELVRLLANKITIIDHQDQQSSAR